MQVDDSIGPRGVIFIASGRICQYIHVTAAVDASRPRREESSNQEARLWHGLYISFSELFVFLVHLYFPSP